MMVPTWSQQRLGYCLTQYLHTYNLGQTNTIFLRRQREKALLVKNQENLAQTWQSLDNIIPQYLVYISSNTGSSTESKYFNFGKQPFHFHSSTSEFWIDDDEMVLKRKDLYKTTSSGCQSIWFLPRPEALSCFWSKQKGGVAFGGERSHVSPVVIPK